MDNSKRVEVEYFLPSTGERGRYYRRVAEATPEATPETATVAEEVSAAAA